MNKQQNMMDNHQHDQLGTFVDASVLDEKTSILKPQLDSIFAEVESSLPSIDFDGIEISDESSDEDVAIFQRDIPTSAFEPNDVRNLEEVDICIETNEDTLKEIFPSKEKLFIDKSQVDAVSAPPADTFAIKRIEINDETAQNSLRDAENSELPVVIGDNWLVPIEGCESLEISGIDRNDEAETVSSFKPVVSRSATMSTDVSSQNKRCQTRQSETSEGMVSQYFTVPIMPSFDDQLQGDIDKLLTSATSGRGRDTEVTSVIAALHQLEDDAKYGQGDGKSLIEKLAQLSVDQSGTELQEVDFETGALKISRQSEFNVKKIKTFRKKSAGTGQSRERSPPDTNKTQPDTVFLDLRDYDKNKLQQKLGVEAVQRILHLTRQREQVTHSSDSAEEDDVILWHEQRRRIKQALKTTGKMPEELDMVQTIPSKKQASSHTDEQHTHAQRLARPATATSKSSNVIDEMQNSDGSEIKNTAPRGTASEKETDRQKTKRTERKLREQQEQEHKSRQRLGKRIEVLRPLTSVPNGKQACAEATPTIFDLEASYESAPVPLPEVLSKNLECVLLTIHLSTSGEVVMHRGSANKSVDLGQTFSATYATLLAWLLSLVPDNFTSMTEVAVPAPFHVIGMQQMYLDRQLCLQVAVCPSQNFSTKDALGRARKSKKREEMKGSTPFQQVLSRFLTTNTLQSTCPWVKCFESMDITSQKESTSKVHFVYSPPLPSISGRPLSSFIQLNWNQNAADKVLNIPVGFFWQTVENEEGQLKQDCSDKGIDYDMQTTMSLVYKKVYRDPHIMTGILYRVIQEGLDLAGVRLLYPTYDMMTTTNGFVNSTKTPKVQSQCQLDILNNIGPVLALGIRGTLARSKWLDAIGPSDPALARKTDPYSLCALYGSESREESLLFCPRNFMRVHNELVRWFGGRVPDTGVIDVGTGTQGKPSSGHKKSKCSSTADARLGTMPVAVHKPPATLIACIVSEIFLVLSPLVPTRSVGLVLAICQRRGFQLRGVKRTHLTAKRAASLGILGPQCGVFSCRTSGSVTPTSPAGLGDAAIDAGELEKRLEPSRPSTILQLSKENAGHNSASLIEAIMVQLSMQGVLAEIQEDSVEPITSSVLFRATPYSDGILNTLGGDFSKVPAGEMSPAPGYIQPQIYSSPELEQIVVVTLTGFQAAKDAGILLSLSIVPALKRQENNLLITGQLQNLVPYGKSKSWECVGEGFELLGLKWLPSLGLQQARELTPYEVGEREWKSSIRQLTSAPAVVIVLRDLNAFKKLEKLVGCRPHDSTSPRGLCLEKLMSLSPDIAYRQVALFFQDNELFADPNSRRMLPYLPPVRTVLRQQCDEQKGAKKYRKKWRGQQSTKSDTYPGAVEESIFHTMLCGPCPLTSIMVIKPDVLRRSFGKLLKRVAHEGFKIVGMRLETLTRDAAKAIVPLSDVENEVLASIHSDYMSSAPSILLCVQRENAVKKVLDLLGHDDPQVAKRQGSHMWRAMFGSDPVRNGLYASTSYKKSMDDQKHFFPDGLCCKPTENLQEEEISCPALDHLLDMNPTKKRKVEIQHQPLSSALSSSILTVSSTMTKSMGTSTSTFTYHVSALTQTNCVVLMPPLLLPEARGRKWPYINIIDFLLTHGFDLVGARMVWFSDLQAKNYLRLSGNQTRALVTLLTHGPCIVLAVQRDNAIMAFDSLLGGPYGHEKDSILSRYGSRIMRSKDMEQACDQLAFLFDKLAPGAQVKIVAPSAE